MVQLVFCRRCDAHQAVLGRRCVLCGDEVARPPAQPRSRLRPFLPLLAGWVAVGVAAVVAPADTERAVAALVHAALLTVTYVAAPWLGQRAHAHRNSSFGLVQVPTATQASFTAWVIRGLVLGGFVWLVFAI